MLSDSQTVGTPVSQTVGTPISETAGTHISETAGTPVSETAGTPISQTAGTPISETAGTHISQTAGTPVSQTVVLLSLRLVLWCISQAACSCSLAKTAQLSLVQRREARPHRLFHMLRPRQKQRPAVSRVIARLP